MQSPEEPASVLLGPEYFEPRDFEYAQPLYDLAFLLQVDSVAKKAPVPEYRTFALWKAALSLDGYTSNVHRSLEDESFRASLDFDPSARITQYLRTIGRTGSLPELEDLLSEAHRGCLRLRAIRGLGAKQLAEALSDGHLTPEWVTRAERSTGLEARELQRAWDGAADSRWEAAHVVPPLLRLLRRVELAVGTDCDWVADKLSNGLEPIVGTIKVAGSFCGAKSAGVRTVEVFRSDPFFVLEKWSDNEALLRHRLGWKLQLNLSARGEGGGVSLASMARQADALLPLRKGRLLGDLHAHSNWSDGAASIQAMAEAAKSMGMEYLAVTDHSRSSKLQGGLTPVSWLRQAVSLSLLRPGIRVLHGIEADILSDGSLDLPSGLLSGMDIVVGSVHTSWGQDRLGNTDRILRSIESGRIDILGHPTSTILGKPGVPNYYRPPVEADWDRIFEACKQWSVALEFNCFPSRLDLLLPLLSRASEAGCWVAVGSDAHSRAHLEHLRIAERVLPFVHSGRVLNLLSDRELTNWLKAARRKRSKAASGKRGTSQQEFSWGLERVERPMPIVVEVAHHLKVPAGSRVVGLDLTASKAKPTGVAVLDGMNAKTCSLSSDEEILEFIKETQPAYVSIDSPLGLPGGATEIEPEAGIVRAAEHDLASVGIPSYPALIDSMKPLTLRGIKLRREIEALPSAPKVIESYPGAAQDILCIPRKQEGLDLLRSGLRELGLKGKGLDTQSHDEMDAITAAVVGRFFEAGEFEPMGIPAEAQLIVPKLHPLAFEKLPIICLTGKTGVGKSVVARYLSLFYGFHWLRTRDLIRELLLEDLKAPASERIYPNKIRAEDIGDSDLRAFGIIVLERYRQEPLTRKLTESVARITRPVVVDAVRDLTDFTSLLNSQREAVLWYVDAPEAAIRQRLLDRQKGLKRGPAGENRIDQKMDSLRMRAHACLRNDSSLEDLRWRVDDELFRNMSFDCSPARKATL